MCCSNRNCRGGFLIATAICLAKNSKADVDRYVNKTARMVLILLALHVSKNGDANVQWDADQGIIRAIVGGSCLRTMGSSKDCNTGIDGN